MAEIDTPLGHPPGSTGAKRDPSGPRVAGSRRILSMRVDAADYESAVETIVDMAEAGRGGMTCVATVHMVMEAWDDRFYRRVVNGSELVTSDGMPLVWALRALGLPTAERVYGPELMPRLCRRAATLGIPVGLLGGSEALLSDLAGRLSREIPGLEVVFRHAPAFGPAPSQPDEALVDAISASGARILFVGLGCPKQERWMHVHRDALACAQVGVGAAFDFLAGAKPQAPKLVQDAGLEWLFRLAHEPRRLLRRYAVHNPRFVAAFARQLLREWRG
jgi:N-acetylglucosaminyldiphosphoundecaprenol N-acetyl-beta-D-mannosaminyltransferase